MSHGINSFAPSSDSNVPPSAADPLDELAVLRDRVNHFQSQQTDLILAELQHLRELAVLNRTADALGQRRSFEQVLIDALQETSSILGTQTLWLIRPDNQGRITSVQKLEGPCDAESLPQEARDLFHRIAVEHAGQFLSMPNYDPDKEQGLYLGVGLHSAKHLLGVVVAYGTDMAGLTDSHRTRILQSVLHQTAVAARNARLLTLMSRMVVDVVIAMALAIESRDPYTGGHVERVTAYSLMLGQRAGLDQTQLSFLRLGGLLHDIGKVAVPDAILRKPGRLDEAEFAIMKTHAAVGHQIISPIPQFREAAPIVRSHHERFDGKGYPDGIGGTDIPLLARVAAIADTFDAMTSDRPYRKGLAVQVAMEEISKCAGTQFDPDLVKFFVDGPPERFAQAVDQMRQWRQAGQARNDLAGLLDMLDADLLRTET